MQSCKTILVTRPNHDLTVNYLFFFAEKVIELAKRKNFIVLDLKGKNATKKVFESYIKINSPSFLFLNGHGSKEIVAGQDNEPLLTLDDNEKLAKGKIVYSLSCQSGAKLGKSLVQKGKAKAFIGYQQNFIFTTKNGFETKPLQDKLAARFLAPSNLIATTLIKGHSVGKAYNRSQEAMQKNLHFMLSSAATDEEKKSAFFLSSNMKCQVAWGDKNAVI